MKHLLELVGGGLALAGGVYAYKRYQGAPPASPSTPSVLPTPAATGTQVAIQPASTAATQSLGGGVTSSDSGNGTDVLTGGDIGQDVTGTNSTATNNDTTSSDTTSSDDSIADDVSSAASAIASFLDL